MQWYIHIHRGHLMAVKILSFLIIREHLLIMLLHLNVRLQIQDYFNIAIHMLSYYFFFPQLLIFQHSYYSAVFFVVYLYHFLNLEIHLILTVHSSTYFSSLFEYPKEIILPSMTEIGNLRRKNSMLRMSVAQPYNHQGKAYFLACNWVLWRGNYCNSYTAASLWIV